ncbi:MAG: hypothetical protein U0792_03920 [Gemmataceae bacterium]
MARPVDADRHPQWGDELAGYFASGSIIEKMTPPEQDELVNRAVPFAKTGTIHQGSRRGTSRHCHRPGATGHPSRYGSLRVESLPHSVETRGATGGCSRVVEVLKDAIAVLRAVPPTAADYADMMTAVEKYRKTTNILAKGCVFAACGWAGGQSVSGQTTRRMCSPICTAIVKVQFVPLRLGCCSRFAAPESLIELAAALKTVNPIELSKVVGVFEIDRHSGRAGVRGGETRPCSRAIRVEMVKPILEKYPKAVQAEASFYAELAVRKGETAKLDKLLAELKPGDIRRRRWCSTRRRRTASRATRSGTSAG